MPCLREKCMVDRHKQRCRFLQQKRHCFSSSLPYGRRGVLNPSGGQAGSNDPPIALWLAHDFPPTTTSNIKAARVLVVLDLAHFAFAQMTNLRIHDWLTSQIKRQKLSPLRFSGRHNEFDAQALTTREILDFDFMAGCSGFVELRMFEITTTNATDEIIMVTGGADDDVDEQGLVRQASQKLHSVANRDNRSLSLPLGNAAHNPDKTQHLI